MSPDSWDWLANGLSWSGAPIDASFRPPGLPLVIAALHRLGVLNALPILNFAMLALAAALLYRWIRLRHSAVVAALACLLFVSNGSLFGYVRFVMAEVWTLPFLVAAAIAFTRAAARPRAYITCGLLLGESFLFHYAGAIVALAMAAALLFHRRADLRSRWPWLGLLSAMPLPAIWLVLRAQHGRASTNVHVIEALVRPSLAHIAYYSVTAVALLGLAALPLYLLGLFRLLPGRGERLTPWAQAALFPLVALAVFFGFLYDWQDKRFLYYLLPFSVAVAAEGISALRNFARGGKLRAAVAGLALGAVLFSNRIPYPAGTHSYVALTPSDFLDAAEGIGTAHVQSIPASGSWSLLTQDGFLSFARARGSCQMQAEATAIPSLRKFLDERLTRSEPVAWAGEGADSTSYWIETNRLAIALERAVVKPDSTRFILRRLHKPDPRALAAFGPFELFDLASFGRSSISLRRRGEHKDRRDREPLPRWHHRPLAV